MKAGEVDWRRGRISRLSWASTTREKIDLTRFQFVTGGQEKVGIHSNDKEGKGDDRRRNGVFIRGKKDGCAGYVERILSLIASRSLLKNTTRFEETEWTSLQTGQKRKRKKTKRRQKRVSTLKRRWGLSRDGIDQGGG